MFAQLCAPLMICYFFLLLAFGQVSVAGFILIPHFYYCYIRIASSLELASTNDFFDTQHNDATIATHSFLIAHMIASVPGSFGNGRESRRNCPPRHKTGENQDKKRQGGGRGGRRNGHKRKNDDMKKGVLARFATVWHSRIRFTAQR